LDHNLIHSTNL